MIRSVLSAALMLGFSAAAPAQLLVKDGDKVAFLGDSITTDGWNKQGGYVRLVKDGLEKQGVKIEAIGAGVGGDKSDQMLARLERDVLSKSPQWMTLSCGVNDVWHGANGVSLEDYKENITAIVDRAEAAGVKVVLLTATPIGEEDNEKNQRLVAYNAFLREFARSRNLPLADLNADFHKVLDQLETSKDSRWVTVDGVHMNPEGNVLMAKGVLKAFGLTDAQVSDLEKQWATQPDTAALMVYPFDPRPGNAITLGEYRSLASAAHAKKVSTPDYLRSLWLRSMSKVVEAHAADAVLDPEAIKKETEQQLAVDIRASAAH